jgi:hypothetical protein
MRRWTQRVRQQTNSGLNIAHAGEGDINLALGPNAEVLREAYRAEALALLPERLLDREAEQSELIRLVRSDGYVWFQGPPWAGKTALMSWLIANPPPHTRIACFFVNSRIPSEADSRAFSRAIVRQLASIVGLEIGYEIPEEARSGQLIHLLSSAAKAANNSGQRLVMVVDGLDEDKGQSPSIAYTLPRRLPEGVRIIVTSRNYPLLPPDVPGDHPLRDCERRTLEPSSHAIRIRDDAAYEIARHLTIGIDRDLIGFLVAAGGGGLSSNDLAELTGMRSRVSVTDLLHRQFGRIIDVVPRGSESAWMLSHDMLFETARGRLAEELSRYLDRIKLWADSYRDKDWPDNTPDYLLHSYANTLLSCGEVHRAAMLAIDRQRHDLMLDRTSSHAIALDEIASVQRSLIRARDPDLRSLAILAFNKFAIGARSAALPGKLPNVWARLGEIDRGESLARTIVWPEERGLALVDVAFAAAPIDTDRATALCRSAHAVVPHIDRTGGQVGVLADIVRVIASFDPDSAERFVASLTDPRTVALGLAEIAATLADADPMRAVKLCEKAMALSPRESDGYIPLDAFTEPVRVLAAIDPKRADALVRKITEPQVQAAVLIAIADVVAHKDLEYARAAWAKAERLVKAASPKSWHREDNLADLAASIATIDLNKAKGIVRSIADSTRRINALINVAVAAIPHSPREAGELVLSLVGPDSGVSPLTSFAGALALSDASRAEELAYTIEKVAERASVLVKVMSVIGRESSEHALEICEAVEGIANSLDDPIERAALLTNIASAMVGISKEHTIRLCKDAEHAARRATDLVSLGCVVSKVASALVDLEPGRAEVFCERSELIANMVDSTGRDFVLAEVAVALSAIEPDRGMSVLDSIADGDCYLDAASRILNVIARTDCSRISSIFRSIARFEYSTLFSDEYHGSAVEELARADPGAARDIVDSVPDSYPLTRVMLLSRMAKSILEVEVRQAFKLREDAMQSLAAISVPYERALAFAWLASAFTSVDHDRALQLLDEAEMTARSLAGDRHREMAMAKMVYPVAIVDPPRAQSICESLVDEGWRAHALAAFCCVLTADTSADSSFVRTALANLLALTEYDIWGGDWTSSLNSLAVVEPDAIKAIADQLDMELARYPELGRAVPPPEVL